MDDSLKLAFSTRGRTGLRSAGVFAIDHFGQPADDTIEPAAAAEGMWLLCDAAQSFGVTYQRKVGIIGQMTTTSFFPAKSFGAYGDGGAIFVDDDETNKFCARCWYAAKVSTNTTTSVLA